MKNFFRLFCRKSGIYYIEEIESRFQESLKTTDKAVADQLLAAKNAAAQQPMLNLAVARVHFAAHDPNMISRKWQQVMAEFSTHGRPSTQDRSLRAFNSADFDKHYYPKSTISTGAAPQLTATGARNARRSRLAPFKKLANSLMEHWDGIVAFLETRVTNGVMEAINGLLQLAKRMSTGFRSFRNFRFMALLKAGRLQLQLPSIPPT